MSRVILHIDMDAFYASIEQRDQPPLRGRPVIVGGSAEGRGVVSAASYEARRFGVHSAMPTVTARRLCPGGVFLPVRMDHYARVSRQIQEIFHQFTPLVQPLSLDEAYLDVSGSQRLFGSGAEIGRAIKRGIHENTQLVASVGIAPTKRVAKIASDLNKPDGFLEIAPEQVQLFLDPLPITRIGGVGRKTATRLNHLGIHTIQQLRTTPLPALNAALGERVGEDLQRLARGEDGGEVVPDAAAKALSAERTFPEDILDIDTLREIALQLCDQVGRRLRKHNRQARTVQIKLRYDTFQTITRRHTLANPTDTTDEMWEHVGNLISQTDAGKRPVRLLGVGGTGLVPAGERQLMLFDEEQTQSHRNLDAATDQIRDRFGAGSVRRGATVKRPKPSTDHD